MTGTVRMGDGCAIHYRFDGAADAPLLLLSNSLGTTMDMWEPQLEHLTSRFRVLRYDARGHGGSDAPAGGYSLDRLGRDVVEMLDALALDRVSFCGLSMGGMVGQWLGVRAPDRLDRMVLANTSAFMGPPSAWDDRIVAVRERGMGAIAEVVVERWFTDRFRRLSAGAVAAVLSMLRSTDPAGYAGCCAAIRDMDLRATAPLILVPTLVIAGEADPATPPAHGEALAAAIPGARIVLLPAAHLSNVEAPSRFRDTVLAFLGRG